MEVVKKINPLDIPEILNSVLIYVGGSDADGSSNTKHLFKARLVSHLWNFVAIKLIQPQIKTIFANPDLESFTELNPYEVLKNYNRVIPGVKICLQIDISNEEGRKFQHKDVYIQKILAFLTSTDEHRPTASLHTSSCMEMGYAPFWDLIKRLAPNLKEVKSIAKLEKSTVKNCQLIFRKAGETSFFDTTDFPCLENIEYSIPPPSTRASSVIPNLLITMINKSSSTLKSLKLAEQPCINPNIQESVEGLKNLLKQTSSTLNNLHKLEIIIYSEQELINVLCSTAYNNLMCLVLHSINLHPKFLEFLADKCPLLSTLEIVLLGTWGTSIPAEFLQLDVERIRIPKIKTLGLVSFGARSVCIIKHLWAMAAIFPSVSHFEADFLTYICVGRITIGPRLERIQEGGEYEGLVYPNVTSMLIKAIHGHPGGILADDSTFRSLVSKIWPNLTHLSIDRVDDETVQAVSSGILIKLLSRYDGITSLELITDILVDGEEDWCTEIFKPNPILDQLKQNVQELSLRLPVALKQTSHTARDISSYLRRICETFYNLQVLRVDEALLKNPQQRSFQQLLQLSSLKSTFPNLQFKTL